jgi:hypothetical protein
MTQLAHQTVHVRVDGRSKEIPLAQLNVAQNSTDSQLKDAVACYLDLPVDSLGSHVIVRTTQAIIIRPEALYG